MKTIDINTVIAQRQESFESLLDEVMEKTMHPRDKYEIAAIIESLGWNDKRASKTFGARDVFELAESLWDSMGQKVSTAPFVPVEKIDFWTTVKFIIKSFLRGTIFALPMAISVISMLTLRFSLWSYENLSTEIATCIAIGTILSFMAVGGFTQAIARRGFFYINQGFYNMARRVTFYFVKLGFIMCLIIAIIFFIFNLFFEIFPFNMVIIIIGYFMFLSANWLSVTIMYILKKELTFTGLLTAGIAIVFVLFKMLNLDILISQIIALFFVSISGIILVLLFFIRAERKSEKGISPPLPRKSILIYSVMPFFEYGFLYFTFLFCDRVVAWSRNDVYMPYLIWFRGAYELGLDFALLMLIIPMGFSEVVVNRLMIDLENTQRSDVNEEVKSLDNKYRSLYFNSLIMVSSSAVVSAILVFLIVKFFDSSSSTFIRTNALSDPTTYFVFIVALCAYAILSVGLMNAIILFSLSQPEVVVKAMLKAFGVNIVVGFLLSRWFAYSFAVIGLLVGSVVFLFLTIGDVKKVLRNLDYYIYAAT